MLRLAGVEPGAEDAAGCGRAPRAGRRRARALPRRARARERAFGGDDRLVADYVRDEILRGLGRGQAPAAGDGRARDADRPVVRSRPGAHGLGGRAVATSPASRGADPPRSLRRALPSSPARGRDAPRRAPAARARARGRAAPPRLRVARRPGRRDRAIRHAVGAREIQRASELVWSASPHAVSHGRKAEVEDWLALFSDAELVATPLLAVARRERPARVRPGPARRALGGDGRGRRLADARARRGRRVPRPSGARARRARDAWPTMPGGRSRSSPRRARGGRLPACSAARRPSSRAATTKRSRSSRRAPGARRSRRPTSTRVPHAARAGGDRGRRLGGGEGARHARSRPGRALPPRRLPDRRARLRDVGARPRPPRARRGGAAGPPDGAAAARRDDRRRRLVRGGARGRAREGRDPAQRSQRRAQAADRRQPEDASGPGRRDARRPGWTTRGRSWTRCWGTGSTPPSSLTTAELRILRFLPTHLSFREIAERVHVSANTVKSQANAVYRKLDVSGRSEAVSRARQLGLLDA